MYSVKDFLLLLVVACIFFTLVVKGLTIENMIKDLKLDKLKSLELFEKYEGEVLIHHAIINKIDLMSEDYCISKGDYDTLKTKYESKLEQARLKIKQFLLSHADADALIHRALALHALGIEKQYLKEMYTYNEVGEQLYLYLLNKLEKQENRLYR